MALLLGRAAMTRGAMTRGAAGRGTVGPQAGLDPMIQQMLIQEFAPGQSGQPEEPPPPRLSRQYDDNDYEDEPPRRRRNRRRKSSRDDDDDDDDDKYDKEDDEEDEEEKEKKRIKEIESKLAQVNIKNQKLYNIDKENAIKFKKAYYEGEHGDIKKFNVQINYNGVNATIYKIKKKNNKIFSVFIMVGTESTEISRRQIMINGSPVTNLSIINKIMDECYEKSSQ